MVKQLYTARNNREIHRVHGEEKREEGNRGDQEEKREGQKRREKSS